MHNCSGGNDLLVIIFLAYSFFILHMLYFLNYLGKRFVKEHIVVLSERQRSFLLFLALAIMPVVLSEDPVSTALRVVLFWSVIFLLLFAMKMFRPKWFDALDAHLRS